MASKAPDEKLLAYDVISHGTRPLVLLHGFLGSGRNLRTLARNLKTHDIRARVILADHLGHGESPPLPERADLFTLAQAVLDTLSEIGAKEQITFVGHSLGGRVALAAKQLAPTRVDRTVLVDIAPGPTAHLSSADVAERLRALPDEAPSREAFSTPLVESGLTPALVNWLMMNVERVPGGNFRWKIDRKALFGMNDRSGTTDLWPVVEGGAEVRVIRGGDSPYVSPKDVERFEKHGIPVETIEGAGHFVHAERPDELFSAVQRALR